MVTCLCTVCKNGSNLLHHVQRNKCVKVVTLLVKQTLGLLLSFDNEENLPIPYTIHRGLSLSVVEMLVENCPVSLLVANKYGQIPVHLFSTATSNVQCMLIQQSSAQALLVADSKGQ